MKTTKDRPAGDAPRRKRVFIVDDHPITRYGLVRLINEEPDLIVCGEAESTEQALQTLVAARPDLVLADITMPGKSGLEFIKEMQCRGQVVPVLVMSMHDEGLYAERVLRAGGRGYIMKCEGGVKLLEAIREVLRGGVFVSRRVSASILDGLTRQRKGVVPDRPGTLSDREFEVFQLLGQGLSTREIGGRLNLSVKTVGTHRVHIRQKLGLRNGADLMRQAVRWAAAQQLV